MSNENQRNTKNIDLDTISGRCCHVLNLAGKYCFCFVCIPIVEIINYCIFIPYLPIYGICSLGEYIFTGNTRMSDCVLWYLTPLSVQACMFVYLTTHN